MVTRRIKTEICSVRYFKGYKTIVVTPDIIKQFNEQSKDMQLEKYDDYDEDGILIEEKEDWKDIALNITGIPTLKFSDIKEMPFTEIHSKIIPGDSYAAYIDAYSELGFYMYCYQIYNKFNPYTYRFEKFNVSMFIKNLFKYYKVPTTAYVKTSYQDNNGALITSMIIGFSDTLWMYIDGPDKGILYYDPKDEYDPKSLLHTVLGLLKTAKRPKIAKNKIYIVHRNSHGFEKTGFNISKRKIDLNENYNDDFVPISDKIIEGLNNKKKTYLVILSGEYGTGKTSYIRYLATKLKKNIIFISSDMVESITDPSFIPFLMSNNDAILIIEDAEPALEKRGSGGRTSAVSNVLNLTDGLLSDCLKISIVATFNTKEKNIDEALMRKGRLLMNYKFERLQLNKTKNLLKKLGHDENEVKEPMTLADIYYYGTDNNAKTNKGKRIGFTN